MAKGILIAAMDFSAAPEDEFHDWYDLEHIPERLRVPGFLNADRWIGIDNPKISVATYDLDNVSVLHSPAYLAVGGDNGSPWTNRTAKFRNCRQHLSSVPEQNAAVFEVLIGQMAEYRDIDPILGKALGVLGHAEFSEPVRNLLHRGAPPTNLAVFRAKISD